MVFSVEGLNLPPVSNNDTDGSVPGISASLSLGNTAAPGCKYSDAKASNFIPVWHGMFDWLNFDAQEMNFDGGTSTSIYLML